MQNPFNIIDSEFNVLEKSFGLPAGNFLYIT